MENLIGIGIPVVVILIGLIALGKVYVSYRWPKEEKEDWSGEEILKREG